MCLEKLYPGRVWKKTKTKYLQFECVHIDQQCMIAKLSLSIHCLWSELPVTRACVCNDTFATGQLHHQSHQPISSWKKKVLGGDQDKLAYCVNPPCHQGQEDMAAQLRRKVSRVESLRKLLLGASHLDTRNCLINPFFSFLDLNNMFKVTWLFLDIFMN